MARKKEFEEKVSYLLKNMKLSIKEADNAARFIIKHRGCPTICLSFSLIPDFFLGIYYSTHILPFDFLVPLHIFTHLIFSPIAIAILLILKYLVDINREPVWIMGLWCVILHIVMDLFIQEIGWFI